MDYTDYTDIDFIWDTYFVEWVTNPNPENDRFWQNWIANHPERTQELLTAKSFIQNLRYRHNHRLDEVAVEKILENIIHFKNDGEFKITPVRKVTGRFYWHVAAVFFLIFFSAILYVRWPVDTPASEDDKMITKISPKGVKMKIVLPDGTEVNLNSESTIRYPSTFGEKERQVHFSGEAFFNVYPNHSKPFKIHSENFETEVLGTTFNIRAYPTELTGKVAVANGLVKVINHQGEQMLLSMHEMAVLDIQRATIDRTSFNLQEELGWKDGILHFNNIPLSNVFDKLERWFGVNIHCASGVRLNDIYNGKYINESLENILKGIGFTSQFDFAITGNNVYISTGKEVPQN